MNLKQQHLEAIEESKEWVTVIDGTLRKVVDGKAAEKNEAITLEHMGKFAEWVNSRDGCYIPTEKIPELIALYSESLNPKP